MRIVHKNQIHVTVYPNNDTSGTVSGENALSEDSNLQSGDVNEESMQTSEDSQDASSLVLIEEGIVKIEEIDDEMSASGYNTEAEQKIEVTRPGELSTSVFFLTYSIRNYLINLG